jgi:Porin PorA
MAEGKFMRRFLGPVLLGVGVFLVVLAALLKFFVADRVIVTPIDQYAQTVSPGPGTYLDPGALQERTGDLVARRTLKADVPASDKDTAVWDVSVVLSTGDNTFVRATTDRVATDRRTAEAVNCCGEAVNSAPTRHTGVSYKFPFGTEKQDYNFWDPNAQRATPAKYVSEDTVQGLTTYKFVAQLPATQIQTQEVPGSLVGENAPSVQAPVFYADTRTVWVEPKTGVIVKGSEQNRTTLRNSAGQDKAVVLDYDLTFDEDTQKSQAQLARDNIGKIDLVTTWLPLIGLLVGLVLIAAGLILMRAADVAARRPEEEPVPAGASPAE